ncbi:MAG: hypothetical protein NTV34_04590 [Proteobacteria bacterium]|nr:hypothetical protein [Pseudomonadota bacterium]
MNISDPEPMNVNEIAPPDTWPDLVSWKRPKEFFHLIAHVFGPRQSVELPASRSATWGLPGYLLQEFHHIPNGNYSNNIADGYSRGFDVSMLGLTHSMRRKLAPAGHLPWILAVAAERWPKSL